MLFVSRLKKIRHHADIFICDFQLVQVLCSRISILVMEIFSQIDLIIWFDHFRCNKCSCFSALANFPIVFSFKAILHDYFQ